MLRWNGALFVFVSCFNKFLLSSDPSWMKFNEKKIKYLRMMPAGLSLEAHSDCRPRVCRDCGESVAAFMLENWKWNWTLLSCVTKKRGGVGAVLNFNSGGPGTQRRLPLQKAHSKTCYIHFKLLKGNYFTKIISHVKAALANCTVYGYFVSHLHFWAHT